MSSYRPERVAGQIHKIISELFLSGEIKDPRIAQVTLTEVKITRDLRLARVYYSVLGDAADKETAVAGLKAVAPFVRRFLGQEMSLRHVPEVRFEFDASADTGRRIDDLLREARVETSDD